MSRSSWKPPFLPPVRRTFVDSSRLSAASAEASLRPRSVRLGTARVGRRFRVLRGLRAVSLLVTPEIVGHAFGEFVPTRKRPRLVRAASKSAKPVKGKTPAAKTTARKL